MAVSVDGEAEIWTTHGGPTGRMVLTTADKAAEIQGKFNHFKKHYEKEVAIFFEAFVQANALYRETKEDREPKKDTRTPEEKARDRRIVEMARGVERAKYLKQLKG